MKPTALIFTLSALFAARSIASETLAVLPDSAAALGMAGGRYANLSDPSAVRINPANILGIAEPDAQVNFGAWYGDIKFTAPNGQTERMADPWKFLGSAYFVEPITAGKTAWGFGLSTPYGIESSWPQNGYFKYLIPYKATLLTADLTPAFAFQATDTLSIGIGMDIMYSQFTLKQQFPWSKLTGTAVADGVFDFDGSGWGFGGFAGVTWAPVKGQRFSLTGHLPIKVNYNGDFTASNVPAAVQAIGVASRTDFNSSIKYPGSLAAGYGWDVTDRLTIGLDVQWAENSTHKEVPLNIGRDQLLLGSTGVPLNWKDSWEAGVGVQYKLNEHWVLRAGYLFTENSQPDATFTPSVPSGQRQLTSAGVGWHDKQNAIDFAYAYVAYPDRSISNDLQPAFNGRYQISWSVISLSYTRKF